jgi:hypothetical protein
MPTANERLFDGLISTTVDIERYNATLARKIRRLLLDVQKEIIVEVTGAILDAESLSSFRGRRLSRLLMEIDKITKSAYGEISVEMQKKLIDLSGLIITSTNNLINSTVGITLSQISLSHEKLKSIVENTLIDGGLIGDWWEKSQAKITDEAQRAIRHELFERAILEAQRGIAKGEAVDVIARRIKDVLSISSKQSISLAKTSVFQVTSKIREEVYAKNEYLFKGYQFVATLDNRTCLTEDQKVLTSSGYKKILEIEEGEYVIGGLSFKNKRVIGKSKSVTKKLAIVTLMNGEKIKCTPDHLFLLEDGRWVEAQELDQEMELKELC